MWCIRCQREVEHRPIYGDDNLRCSLCGMNTLAYIQPKANESNEEMIKQMVGEAQRVAQKTGRTGDIEVSRTINSSNDNFQTQILVYNTYTGIYRSSRK